MESRSFENLLKTDIETVFTEILKDLDHTLPLSSRSEKNTKIRNRLKECFSKYIIENSHPRIYNCSCSAPGSKKSPYDICINYKTDDGAFDDLIWCNIKILNDSFDDENPNLGNAEDVISFIKDGHFYVVSVILLCESDDNNGTVFVDFNNEKYAQCQLLKDIFVTFRIDENQQFQVNILDPEDYRTSEQFLELFRERYTGASNETFDDLKKCLSSYAAKMNLT